MRFQDVLGQARAKEQVVKSVQAGRFAHAQLIAGPEGVGQLPFALATAQYLNCEAPLPTDACGQCKSCRQMAELQHPDLTFILPIISSSKGGKPATSDDFWEAFRGLIRKAPYSSQAEWTQQLDAENKQLLIPIADIRALQKKLTLRAFGGGYKVVILWGADKMNQEAANAFLKLLEEPPERTLLLLITEGAMPLLPTITSRTQRIQLLPLPEADISHYLQTQIEVPTPLAHELAHLAEGSLTEALALASNAHSGQSQLFQDWMRLCYEGKLANLQPWVQSASRLPREGQKILLAFGLQTLRGALRAQLNPAPSAANTEHQQFVQNFGRRLQPHQLEQISGLLEDALHKVNRNANANMLLFVVSLRIHDVLRGRS